MKDNPRVRRRIKILKLEAKKLSEERAACVCTCIYIYIYIYIYVYTYMNTFVSRVSSSQLHPVN